MIGITMITAIMLGMMIEDILHRIITTAVVVVIEIGTTMTIMEVLLEEEGVVITTMRGGIMKKIMMIEQGEDVEVVVADPKPNYQRH